MDDQGDNSPTPGKEDTTVRIRRAFPASRDRMFHAWTDPSALYEWWWPPRFDAKHDVDLREGGVYRFFSTDVPGMALLAVSGRFLEVAAPERLAYTWAWDDASDYVTDVLVTFHESGSGTVVELVHEGFANTTDRDNHARGWNDCLDRLQSQMQSAVAK